MVAPPCCGLLAAARARPAAPPPPGPAAASCSPPPSSTLTGRRTSGISTPPCLPTPCTATVASAAPARAASPRVSLGAAAPHPPASPRGSPTSPGAVLGPRVLRPPCPQAPVSPPHGPLCRFRDRRARAEDPAGRGRCRDVSTGALRAGLGPFPPSLDPGRRLLHGLHPHQ